MTRSFAGRFHAVWVFLLLVAIVAAGFGLSYLAYHHILAGGSVMSVETIGEIWDGSTP
jgi:hypothetical protein